MQCPFCSYDKNIWKENVHETENFQIKIGIGIITAGHCMIVSKNHYDCMGALPDSLVEEYLDLKNKVENISTKKTTKPFSIEYGVFCQSVFHAHTHFIPKTSMEGEYSNINIIEDMVLPAIKKFNIPYIKSDFNGLRKFYKENRQYISFEQDGKLYILKTNSLKKEDIVEDLLYRRFFINKVGIDAVKSWKDMNQRQLAREEKRLEKSKEIFKFRD